MTRSKVMVLGLVVFCGAGLLTAILALTCNAGSQPTPAAPLTSDDCAPVELIGVPGSDVKYPSAIESTFGSDKVKLSLTGTALRKKVIINVYTIASYLQEGAKIDSADDLCNSDSRKQLHLVMQSGISGRKMVDAFTDAIRKSHPKPQFDTELNTLAQKIQAVDLAKGTEIWLTNVPGKGLHIKIVGGLEMQIENVAFSRAIWEIYLGKQNIGEPIKAALVSRLK